MNRRIRVPEVRVIGDDGEQLGVIPTHEALRNAEERGLDLVEVSPKAVPPVCRIMDYGKFKYEQSKKTKQAKKHASVVELKEIKFRPKTATHDLDFKLRLIRRFLEEGNKVRLVVAFRGREIVHPETGRAMINKVILGCQDIAHVEQLPMLDGKRMVTMISPRPGIKKTVPVAPVATAGGKPGAPQPSADEMLQKLNAEVDADADAEGEDAAAPAATAAPAAASPPTTPRA